MAENSGVSAKKRRASGRPFQPGRSGNPGGRPKLKGELLELVRAHSDRAIATLVEALDSLDERVRLSAANSILDRGWGRPSSETEREAAASDPNNAAAEKLRGMSQEELYEIIGVKPI